MTRSRADAGEAHESRRFRARWVLPISRGPIHDADVVVAAGCVVSVEPAHVGRPAVDLGSVAILPGLVNAHTHLELSALRGRVPPARSLPVWVRALMAARMAAEDGVDEAIEAGVAEARAHGTVLLGDVTNGLGAVPILDRRGLSARVFYELVGFGERQAEIRTASATRQLDRCSGAGGVRLSLAAHAPYSVSPDLFRAIRKAAGDEPYATHLAESVEEVEFLQTGGGPWRALLDELGAWDERWAVPACRPLAYMEQLGFLGPGLVMAHGVQLTRPEIARIAASGATLVTCPRSNRWTGAGTPPVAEFFSSGASIAVGTDSLASCPDLNLFSELAELRHLAPAVPAGTLLESATLRGARALGFEATFGSIETGKSDRLITVAVPESEPSVEEYLVSGIRSDQVGWMGGAS